MPTATQRDFYELLAELKAKGTRFTPKHLKLLPYEQLLFPATGVAGVCRCSIEDVVNEKQERRALLIDLPQEQIDRMDLPILLQEDLSNDKIKLSRTIPSWSDLSVISKLYFKLTCLETHPNDPTQRISEIVALCKESESHLPQQLAFSLKLEFQSSLLSKPSYDWIRDTSTKVSNILYGFIPGNEIEIVDKLELRDYVCTAGCFYPLTGE